MCSSYWTLREVKFTCPECGADTSDDLQTHYMGDPDSCLHYYRVGEPVEELAPITTATLGRASEGCPDDFIGQCGECDAWLDFGARITAGRVVEVWPLPNTAQPMEVHR